MSIERTVKVVENVMIGCAFIGFVIIFVKGVLGL